MPRHSANAWQKAAANATQTNSGTHIAASNAKHVVPTRFATFGTVVLIAITPFTNSYLLRLTTPLTEFSQYFFSPIIST